MTRKDFELIAFVIRDLDTSPAEREKIAEAFAQELVTTNARFDKTRFLRVAVGV